MECIVHFEVLHKEGPKALRGLLFLGKDESPDEKQLLDMFRDMNFNVTLADRDNLTFRPADPKEQYSLIRITGFDRGEEKTRDDRELKSVIGNLLPPQRPTGL